MLTKKDLQNIQVMMDETFDRKFEEKFEQIRLYFTNEVLQFKDEILTELVKLRTDYEIIKGKVYQHDEDIYVLHQKVNTIQKSIKTTV